jgi:hypothetical protein
MSTNISLSGRRISHAILMIGIGDKRHPVAVYGVSDYNTPTPQSNFRLFNSVISDYLYFFPGRVAWPSLSTT